MDTATPVSISVKKMPTAALEGNKSYAAPPQSSMVMVGREVSNSSKSAVECDVCSSARAKTARNFVAVRVEKSATYPTSRHQKRRVQRSSRSTTHTLSPSKRCAAALAPRPPATARPSFSAFSGGWGRRKPTASALERKKSQKMTKVTEKATVEIMNSSRHFGLESGSPCTRVLTCFAIRLPKEIMERGR